MLNNAKTTGQMYSSLIANEAKDYLSGQAVLIQAVNINDLEITTNARSVFYEIQSWYQGTAKRKFIEKSPCSPFVQYRGILEGARKSHVFGWFYWLIPITDKMLEIGCSPISGMSHQDVTPPVLMFVTNTAAAIKSPSSQT